MPDPALLVLMHCGGESRRWALCNSEEGATATPDGALMRASLAPQPAEKTKVVSAFVGARSAIEHWVAPSQRVGLRQMRDGHYPLRGPAVSPRDLRIRTADPPPAFAATHGTDFMLHQTHRVRSIIFILTALSLVYSRIMRAPRGRECGASRRGELMERPCRRMQESFEINQVCWCVNPFGPAYVLPSAISSFICKHRFADRRCR